MFLKTKTTASTIDYSAQIEKLTLALAEAEAIVIGAGAGLSTAAGFYYDGERFEKYFADYRRKYGITDMYSGGFYTFETPEESWAWWSRAILINRYECPVGKVYRDLLALVKDKNYFVLTTNVDHQFQRAGFDKARLFYTQGDYGLWQCSVPCHEKTYDNKAAVYEMVKEQRDFRIPTALIPRCPICGATLTMNLRCDDKFVEDDGWYAASKRYKDFLAQNDNNRVLFWELGVGSNTPGIIKYPFWQMTAQNPDATYVSVNYGEALAPAWIKEQAVCINANITTVLNDLKASAKTPQG